ncbi:hypothetical protein D3C75_343480 [compost metagenome]
MKTRPPELKDLEKWINATFRKVRLQQTYTIWIVTDAILGGADPAPTVLGDVRTSTVRGQLRFWWRATRGAAYADAGKLKARERLIFGDTSLASPCRIQVKMHDSRGMSSFSEIPPYVAFPFKDSDKYKKGETPLSLKTAARQRGRGFDMALEYHDAIEIQDNKPITLLDAEEIRYEVEAALWAWINFGGVGARTRRGCGSLYCKRFSPDPVATKSAELLLKWIKEQMEAYKLPVLSKGEYREWPILALLGDKENGIAIRSRSEHGFEKVLDVWKETIKAYFEFRQRRNIREIIETNKTKPTTKPTRSHWPEPDSIRKISGWSDPRHRTIGSVLAFPRAQFGLPIIFQFNTRDTPNQKGNYQGNKQGSVNEEPLKTELNHLDSDRMRLASPLILKPLAIDKNHAYGVIIRLVQPPLGPLRLRQIDKDRTPKIKDQRAITDFQNRLDTLNISTDHIYPGEFISSKYPLLNRGSDAITGFLQSMEVKKWKNRIQQASSKEKSSRNWPLEP